MDFYKGNFKYQSATDQVVQTEIYSEFNIVTSFITLTTDGLLTVKAGYAWDGASGPTWDDDTNYTPSLFHDALAQLIRMGLLDFSWVKKINELLKKMCLARGMNKFRAWYWIKGLELTDGRFAEGKNRRKLCHAP